MHFCEQVIFLIFKTNDYYELDLLKKNVRRQVTILIS